MEVEEMSAYNHVTVVPTNFDRDGTRSDGGRSSGRNDRVNVFGPHVTVRVVD